MLSDLFDKKKSIILAASLTLVLIIIAFIILIFSGRLESLLYDPLLTPEAWCDNQPCVDFGFFILNQPSSSIIVYLVAILTIIVGIYFFKNWDSQISRLWLGSALLFMGIGAALAGTSYQAFGYEIKCLGRIFCIWTSWWEIAYEICTVAGAGAILLAVVCSCVTEKRRKPYYIYTIVSTITYMILTFIGAFIPVQFLISFEMMVIFLLPLYLSIFILCIYKYHQQKAILTFRLLIACILLLFAMGSYYIYSLLGITQELWSQGIWFSDNDVLHILMIVWVLYIYIALGNTLKDT